MESSETEPLFHYLKLSEGMGLRMGRNGVGHDSFVLIIKM